ncbi:hypothetical protein [Xanthomonas graminis]|uniref:Uncharacterized protein n=1 Tax=Xanthomonas graminis pv. arrhenatheri LMG 727 TaxID=1195923 RepID=A0A0K3A4E6_9XANT|nr:hypothetical protein [Xanthomonas translucens]UKE78673.1 hypothetical protein KM317_05435 [Xanthomonas translucens pv. arrhenatheri]CTP92703.1 hypothetical protein XTALMG727_3857 [Xanthomonas translucens pv. arrhenatheri LMG 727]
MACNRFVFGITLDQADALDGLIRTLAAHGKQRGQRKYPFESTISSGPEVSPERQ